MFNYSTFSENSATQADGFVALTIFGFLLAAIVNLQTAFSKNTF